MLRAATGEDPVALRKAERNRGTFAELADAYRDQYAKKNNKSWAHADRPSLGFGWRPDAVNRTAIRRASKPKITPKAIDIFRQMEETDRRDEWWRLHGLLCSELKTSPWQWPCIQRPDAKLPDPAAQQLYRELDAARAAAKY